MADDPMISPEEEKALVEAWFATVQFDKESKGIPPLDPELDDEGRSLVDAAAITAWFVRGPTTVCPIPGSVLDYRYAHLNPQAWNHVDENEIGMSKRVARRILEQEASFVELFLDERHLKGKHDQDKHGGKGGVGKAISDFAGDLKDSVDDIFGKDKNKDEAKERLALGLDSEMAARAARVDRVIGKARKTYATELTETLPGGAWKPERDRIHREIADAIYAKAANVPNERKAVVAGGLGGAGKTTVLTQHANIDTKAYLTLNPDDVKEEMARRGLVPEVPEGEGLSPMERAALIHEESSRITQMVASKALEDGKNVMWDITMSSDKSVQSRLDKLRDKGYGEIRGVFVDIPVEVSVKRAMSRYARGQKSYAAGKGLGGRYVPPAIIRAQRTSSGATINREVFEHMQKQFDGWSMYDNSVDGREPQLIDKT